MSESVIVTRREAAINDAPRDSCRIVGAQVGCFEDRTDHALGRDGIFADVVAVADERTAEVLRPWPIDGGVENGMAEAAGTQFLWLRRECKEGVDLARGEQVERADLRIRSGDPVYVFCGVETDFQSHQPQQIIAKGTDWRFLNELKRELKA